MAGFSEDELVDILRRILSDDDPRVVVGVGDDAAVVEAGRHLDLLTADLLVEDVHFERGRFPPRDLGYKALVVNASDVAAMGGSPRFGLVSLGLPRDVDAAWLVELYGGLREAADEHAVSLVGGDLSRSDRLVVSVALTGEVASGGAVSRRGATPGDVVVVTGWLGSAAGGLRVASADRTETHRLAGRSWARELLRAYLRPTARVGEGQTLAQEGATAMIDVSDGLAKDLARLCRESGVGAAVALDAVPVDPALADLAAILAGVDPLALALGGGEDYELLATLAPSAAERAARRLAERFGTSLTVLGEVREGSGLVAVAADGTERPLEPTGWDHFAA